jgi:hypothetical protein
MKRLFAFLLLSSFVLASGRAELLGNAVEVTAAPGWKSVSAVEPGQTPPPFPVIKFVPADGRNAAVLLSLLPANAPGYEVNDLASLTRFNLVAARPFLPGPDAKPPLTPLKVSGGIGGYIVNEDPALVGKPVPPDEYRIAATATVLLEGKYLINCTIFYDEKDSPDFKEALHILLSAGVHTNNSSI